MANVTAGYAYSTDALLALKAKPLYNLDMGWGFQILFTLSSQVIGIALAGVFRRFLVWPAALIWPANFSITTLLYALHDKSKSDPARTNGWQISRYRFFVYVASGSFVYYWFPRVIWQGLSVFSFVTWIKPNNATINQFFGGFTGLSLIPLTFGQSVSMVRPIGFLAKFESQIGHMSLRTCKTLYSPQRSPTSIP